ncbi:unnamed protein product [Fusarium graminearum]|nr:unnamed protein product [Fusarium graminearum]
MSRSSTPNSKDKARGEFADPCLFRRTTHGIFSAPQDLRSWEDDATDLRQHGMGQILRMAHR